MHRSYRSLSLGLLLLITLGLALTYGATDIRWADLLSPSTPSYSVFWSLRLPRVLLVAIVGATLALLGATYQILFHNPLAEPYLLGVSNAVTLGIAIAELVFQVPPESFGSQLAGVVAALIVTSLIAALALSPLGQEISRITLFGIGLQFTLSATLFLLLSYFSQQMGGGSLRWLFGQVPWLSLSQVGYLGSFALAICGTVLLHARHLDALSLGDSVARTLGVPAVRTRNLLLLLTSILIAAIVACAGAIGFVGLVIPHAVRLMFRPQSSRSLLLHCLWIGPLFLILCDWFARSLFPPLEFPLGVLTAAIGGPLFLILLWRRL